MTDLTLIRLGDIKNNSTIQYTTSLLIMKLQKGMRMVLYNKSKQSVMYIHGTVGKHGNHVIKYCIV